MLCCTDVAYSGSLAVASAVFFEDWASEQAIATHHTEAFSTENYQAGEFFRRELPVLENLLIPHLDKLDTVIVDGYVWLGQKRPGLGRHLYQALQGCVPVIGVAKNSFHDNQTAIPILRGTSQKPLWVTAEGTDPTQAAVRVQQMHGPFRLPTLLKQVDSACRDELMKRRH